ncbi:MAG: M23 family metallopeptidase, partial [Lentisphaerae bacterium]|nr:M23 family metallopeptidase [Lentisphaerota bacterium]
PPPPPPPPPVWQDMVSPTPQTNLLNPDEPGVLQPTGSGRLQSARFGSTRTVKRGNRYVASFHEGVDIAPTARDRRGAATDPVVAVAAGHVAFLNNSGGGSSYGKYVVVEHPDPSLGTIPRRDGGADPAVVYTLYAHLADIRFGIRPGQSVEPGDVLGTMGATSNTRPPIPLSRSHLHWEIGLMLHGRFDARAREQKASNPFGNHNGGNLYGLDPLDFYAAHTRDPGLTMATYLASVPPAFEIAVRGRTPDFFRRYPALWKGLPHDGGPIHLAVSESGVPLSGRNASPDEIQQLGNRRQAVLRVDSDVLGRNGRALIFRSGSRWDFTSRGRQWADVLLY